MSQPSNNGRNGHLSPEEFAAVLDLRLQRNTERYDSFKVLLMRWELAEGLVHVNREVSELREIFATAFHADTEIFKIPSRNPHWHTNNKISDFLPSNEGGKCLNIIYYNGHGQIDAEGHQLEFTPCVHSP